MEKDKKGTLNYYIPKNEKKHTILSIPGSHTLYVGPLSCTRRHCVNAIKYANRQEVSFLFITQADVVSGHYEDLISDSIGDLLKALPEEPEVFMIAVFCIDDFLGTDEDALIARLEERYQGKQFAIQHIDPVSLDERVNMATRKTSTLYSFLLPTDKKDKGINFIGNFVSLPEDCEFLDILKGWGYGPIREIFNLKTYQEYQEMARSAANIVLRFMGERNASYMQDKLGIPFYIFYTSYDPERIEQGYLDIANMLGVGKCDFSKMKEEALKEINETVKLLNGMPVAIDSSASIPTFQTAAALLKYGFNLKYLFRSNHKFKIDEKEENYIVNERPDVKVMRATDYVNLVEERTGTDCRGNINACEDQDKLPLQNNPDEMECVAIGSDCARLLRASHYVDIWHDEGYFGFQGVKKLMREIRHSYESRTDWSKVPELKLKKS